MLPKENRIKKRKDFDEIFKKGKIFRSDSLIFKFKKNNLKKSRFGFVVSLKVSKSAVVRNKIRRRMSEIIGQNMDSIKNGTDLVIIALPGFEKKGFLETKEIISNFIKKCLNF